MFGYIINDYIFTINETKINVCYSKKSTNDFIINQSLKEYLTNIKAEIDGVQNTWDIVKKITNKYEYINSQISFDNYPNKNISVCSYKPISRSYFKMIEILYNFEFNFTSKNMKTFHLAEGPGGFIEAIVNYRKNRSDKYYGMTLMENNSEIPKWNKISNFAKHNTNIEFVLGSNNDGNLYYQHNLEYIHRNFENSMDFITGDGGFDYSDDFNSQEVKSINLIFCEMLYALIMQKKGGSFVLKVFDIFHRNTLEIILILCYFYKKVFVYKPSTSREANSEKYIICLNFDRKSNYSMIIDKLKMNFGDIAKKKITRIFDYELNDFYLNKIQEVNAIYGQQQIENILCTINHVNDYNSSHTKDKLKKIKMNNIEKCKKWCQNYKQPIHHFFSGM